MREKKPSIRLNSIKKAVLMLLTAAVTLLSGCMPYTELSERAIVQAVGLDYEKGNYTAIFQYYHSGGNGGQNGIDVSKPNVITAKGTGKSVYAALTEASFNAGKPPLFGENQIIVLGSGILSTDISETLSFFISDYQCHPKVVVAAAEGKAEDVLNVKYKEGSVSTEKLRKMFENGEKQGFSMQSYLYEITMGLNSVTGCAFFPLLKVEETGTDATEDGKQLKINGGIVISGGKPVAKADQSIAAGLLVLSDRVVETSVSIEYDGTPISIGLYDLSTKITPKLVGGKLGFSVSVNAKGKYLENHISPDNIEGTNALERTIAEYIAKRLADTVKLTANDCGADITNLQSVLRHHEYREWLKREEIWKQEIKELFFDITANITLNRYGLEK